MSEIRILQMAVHELRAARPELDLTAIEELLERAARIRVDLVGPCKKKPTH